MKKVIHTLKAPVPKGPYSQGISHGGTLYISGQVAIEPGSGNVVRGSIEEETRHALKNIKAIVEEIGGKMEDVLKTTCYLSDMEDLDGFNAVYKEFFPHLPPVRTTFQASRLPLDVKVEIDAIVALK